MPNASRFPSNTEPQSAHDYDADPRWRKKPLTPHQLAVHDVRLETLRADRGPMLEIEERSASTLVPDSACHTPPGSQIRISEATSNPIEKQRFTDLEEDYGWIRHLRLTKIQHKSTDDEDSAKCRWIHCSSKFPEYLAGMLWALSDDLETVAASMRVLDAAVQRHTRFSKHGKYFAPFSQCLSATAGDVVASFYPLLTCVPFLDWTIQGPTPPLRFQVDRREGFLSSRSSAHILRSILQYYYRLEDTDDRESSQIFAKHRPWNTNRELDLKVRQWYGHYPTGLNVDELWVLAIDANHIVTFSSNQTWKARWPPLQLTSRISDISFRGIRNNHFRSMEDKEYTALIHLVASVSGAVGMLHRAFWADIVLCLTDRYAGRMGQLQYRLHRSPSTKLVMDLISCQEELNIVIQITEQQVDMIQDLQGMLNAGDPDQEEATRPSSRKHTPVKYGEFDDEYDAPPHKLMSRRSTYRQLSTSVLSDPLAQLLDNLERELVDLKDLRDNMDRLVTRTIQLVNIRLEDHGKAILVFTVVTIIFLPLNFVSSFFGMNTYDIRNLIQGQWLFWAVAASVTVCVVTLSLLLAFSGGAMVERFHMWRDARRERRIGLNTASRQFRANVGESSGFQVYGTDRNIKKNVQAAANGWASSGSSY